MTTSASQQDRYRSALYMLQQRDQQHVLRWWDELSPPQRDQLLRDMESIPWEVVDPLLATHILDRPKTPIPAELGPPWVHPQPPKPEQEKSYREASAYGENLLATGKVAAFTVAGGQGARLGVQGPKGMVTVTPAGSQSLFSLFADMVRAARDRYAAVIPWYIMTSPTNHRQTADYFQEYRFFGLPEKDVKMFSQGMLPCFDHHGKLLLAAKHRIALAPDGHGGSLKALVVSGALEDMRRRGIEIMSYFQVDNPLVKPFDPLFLGLHANGGADMSAKVLPKADDLERVGNLCLHDGCVVLIEYSDFPEHLAHAKNADGTRRFNHGNPAIHLLQVAFVERVIERSFQLPFRRADKVVACVDDRGKIVRPSAPNAVKLESFVFDVLPLAHRVVLLEVDRAEEFSPVKNATGVDSLESARRDQIRRAYRWLEKAGVGLPRTADGEPAATVAIAPTFALDADDLEAKVGQIPAIQLGDTVYLK